MIGHVRLYDNLEKIKEERNYGITEMFFDKPPKVGDVITISIPSRISDLKGNHWYRKLETYPWTVHSLFEQKGELIIDAYYSGEKKMDMWSLKS